MRYIEKVDEPDFLIQYKEEEQKGGQVPNYEKFREKKKLNGKLRKEQHHICCYCQQRLTHYQGDRNGGAHNEHLIPQCEDKGDGLIDLDYNNIYACCIDSVGYEYTKQHCGESKHETPIRGFITEENCSDFFKYNSLGEILPNGSFDKWDEYINNETALTGDIKDSFQTIRTLNLNCNKLVEDRKGDFFALISIINDLSKEEVQRTIANWKNDDQYFRFIDMLLYFMKKKK